MRHRTAMLRREETLREETLETPSQCERVRFPVDVLFRAFLGVTLVDHAVPPMEREILCAIQSARNQEGHRKWTSPAGEETSDPNRTLRASRRVSSAQSRMLCDHSTPAAFGLVTLT